MGGSALGCGGAGAGAEPPAADLVGLVMPMAHCRARKAEVLLANFAQVWVKSSNVCSLGRECVLYWHPPALEIA